MALRNMRVGARCALIFAIIGGLTLSVGGVALYQARAMNAQAEIVRHEWLPGIVAAGELANNLGRSRALTLRSFLEADREERADDMAKVDDVNRDLMLALEKYRSSIRTEESQRVTNEFSDELKSYLTAQHKVLEQVRLGQVLEATKILKSELSPTADATIVLLNRMAKLNEIGANSSADATNHAYDEAVIALVTALIVILLIMLGSSLLLTNSIVRPLSEAVLIAERISQKDLTQEIITGGKDEPAFLLVSLKRMQDSLRQTIEQISDSSEQLASASDELQAVTENANVGLHQQNAEIEQAATAVNEMTVAVEEVASNAVSTADASKEADLTTQDGKQKVELALQSIQGLVSDVSLTAQEIGLLANCANEINKVLDVIGEIADQTNLLALNAAIEAARAGEAGRGFAVVADEVRALAYRTQQSTGEIESMINSIRTGTENTVESMRSSQEKAHSTLAVAESAGIALQTISNAIALINERNLIIASASEEQAQVAREVDRNLINIRDLSLQNSAGANQTNIASQELSKLAVGLHDIVADFKI